MRKPIQFGKYYLLERINVGGMAEVFKAKAFGVEGFERLVAVKRILPNIAEDKEFIQMFIDEAKIAVQLNHANICQIFDLGKVDDSYFIALEFVHGKDLRAIFDRCRQMPLDGTTTMPIPQACFMVMKVCEGLDYAHNKRDQSGRELNLVHRDVSPQNVLISYEGEVKIIDFGIAKAAGKASKTQAGILKGKFGYMSPEQVRGLPLDRGSDIFAVGVVIYELLTGERLFTGESDFSTLEKVRNVEILPPSTYNRRIPDELERIVLKALAKDVEDRYQNAIDLHDDLQAFMYSAGEFYSRKDLAAWMKRTWAAEIEAETASLEAYRHFTPQTAAPSERRAPPPASPDAFGLPLAQAGGQAGRIVSGAAALAAAVAPVDMQADLDWDDEEQETHVYDSPAVVDDTDTEVELPVEALDTFDADDLELAPDGRPVPAKNVQQRIAAAFPPVPRAPEPTDRSAPPLMSKAAPPARSPVMTIELPAAIAPVPLAGIPTAPGLEMMPPGVARALARRRASWPLLVGGGMAAALVTALLVYLFVILPSQPGVLQLFTDPAEGVRLELDSRPAVLDLTHGIRLAPGPHSLLVESEGYATWRDRIEIRPGETLKRRVDLEPLPRAGFTLISEPPGAKVVLDGKELDGVTPFKVEGLFAGAHRIEVRVAGQVWTKTIQLEGGKILDVHAELALPAPPPPPPPPVVASVEPKHEPAEQPHRQHAPDTHAARHEKLPPPPRAEVAPERPAAPPRPQASERAAERSAEKPARGEGYLRLGSKPWAKILVDGSDTGLTTPQTHMTLATGSHRITLVNPGFNVKDTFSVDIKAGETLTQIKDYRPKSSEPGDD